MKKLTYLLSVLFALVMFFSACEEENGETDKPYVGTWKSNMYPSIVKTNTSIDTVLEQMTFEFTNTTFTDAVFRSTSVTDTDVQLQVTIGGDVNNAADSTLSVEINTVKIGDATANKATDSETFKLYFDGSVGSLLFEDFDAVYSIYSSDDSLALTLPVKYDTLVVNQTIRLGKQ